jgi:uncharacterized protein (UPF0254 family)
MLGSTAGIGMGQIACVLQDGNGEEQELIQQNLIILWEYR